ncbi:MAG: VOC family protein [Candidatus Eremiobacteraeota bacterium]|nr:VOC family protein [Candidatus Eremiobacteraeota bacterium]
MQRIVPFLWFDDNAEEAARFYVSIFPNSKIDGDVSRYDDEGLAEPGSVMVVPFQLGGQDFLALNGGPQYTFTPAISLFVRCENQAEVDYYWEKLLEGGGEPVQCGWLKDRFGVSWQVVPSVIGDLIGGSDPEGASRAMKAMLGMVKLDLGELQRAYAGT